MGRFGGWLGLAIVVACGRTELSVGPAFDPGEGGSGGAVGAGGAAGGPVTSSTGGGGEAPGVCGDGQLDPGEDCDDGNQIDADGCEADCSLPACGNDIVDPGELCFGAPAELTLDRAFIHFGPRVVDCDGDGDLDLVQVVGSALFEPTVISALINDGQGAFGALSVESPLGPTHQFYASFALGQFDATPGTDLGFVGQPQSAPASLRIFAGESDCRFTKIQATPLAEPHVFPIALRVDGDDRDDLVALRPSSQRLGLARSGAGYQVVAVPPASQLQAPMTTADLDEDGAAEIIQADPAAGTVLVRRNLTAEPWLGSPTAWPVGTRPFATAAADLDLDMHLDVVVYDGADGQLYRLEGDGGGGLQGPGVAYPTGMPASSAAADLALADLDADGDPDALMTADYGGQTAVGLLVNDGSGAFSAPASAPLPSVLAGQPTLTTLAVADLDGDGALDVIASTYLPLDGFQGQVRIHVFLANP